MTSCAQSGPDPCIDFARRNDYNFFLLIHSLIFVLRGEIPEDREFVSGSFLPGACD